MPSKLIHSSLESAVREIQDFRWEAFRLIDDLRRLEVTLGAGAPEAAVFYAARILEVLTAEAATRAGFERGRECFWTLELLKQYNLMGQATLSWAHALRRLGNDVRHINRGVLLADGEWAVCFIDRILFWYFCQLSVGPRLRELTTDGSQQLYRTVRQMGPLLEFMERGLSVEPVALEVVAGGGQVLLETPAVAALLADQLIAEGKTGLAMAVADRALERFSRSLRLSQLKALALSRGGEPLKAIEMLETQTTKRFRQDIETLGICAGAYKRLWLTDPSDRAPLDNAHRLYVQAWAQSGEPNAYVGVNAATTGFLLGDRQKARQLATTVLGILEQRRRRLVASNSVLTLDYWDEVTIAECRLLLGEIRRAEEGYRHAFASYPERVKNHDVTTFQARLLLQAHGISRPAADSFLRTQTLAPEPSVRDLRVGITGHRRIDGEARIKDQLLATMRQLCDPRGGRPVRLVLQTLLAEGADRLAAHVLLENFRTAGMEVVLPLEVEDYVGDFPSEASRGEFVALFDRAEAIVPPPVPSAPTSGYSSRQAAYLAAGIEVVARSHAVIAVWDGQPARGPGGTAEIVDLAQQAGKPVYWISATTPGPVRQLGPAEEMPTRV